MAQAGDPFSPSSLDYSDRTGFISRCQEILERLQHLELEPSDLYHRWFSRLPEAYTPPVLDERIDCSFGEVLDDMRTRRELRNNFEEILNKTSKYIKFSVSSSQKGGIDIEIGSITARIPMNYRVHNPVVQMLLFAKMSLFQNSCRCPRALACKAIHQIINGSRFDSCNEVYEIDWVPTKCQAESPNEQDISDTRQQKLDRQTDTSTCDWLLSLPVLSDMLKNGAQTSRSNRTHIHWSMVNNGTTVGPVPFQWHAPLKCNVEHLVSSIDLSVSRPEESACCNDGDCNVPNKLSDCSGIPVESISSTELQSQHDGSFDSISEQELEENQYMLKKQSDMSCVSNHQPIYCSRNPEGNEVFMCNTETSFSGSSSTRTLPEIPYWLDSGANHHVVGGNSDLCNQRAPSHAVSVKVADGFQYPVIMVGDIQTADIQVPDVYLVPGLQVNLISVRQLAKSRIVTTFYENHAELWLEGEQVGGAIADNDESLYRLRFLKVIRS